MKHFNEGAKDKMMEMVEDIKAEMKMILDNVQWMDEGTRAKAHEKLQSIKDYIGFPKEILNNTLIEELYDGIEVSNDTFYQNSINMGKWSVKYSWSKFREQIDKTDWKRHANPAVVNAYYSGIENSIQFPAGILQGIFFGKDRPTYMNYASIGWVIGHEITHGFDDKGRQFNQDGNLQNWWDPETKEKFINKTKCIQDQYGKYSVKALNVSLNGITTQGENIADNGGVKQAYRAYEKWMARHGEEQVLPGLNLNQRQLFWLTGANIWCSKYRSKTLKTTLQVGSHAPGMFRVKGTYSNNKDFARDFGCKVGSPYNPPEEDKCEVW
jgi:membrane metallo-endopeptidase-like protein 1